MLVAAWAALPACSVTGLQLRADERVSIVEPGDGSEVRLPFRVTWTADDIETGPGKRSFAVFVDRTPPRPGESLAGQFEDDDACEGVPGCPDERYLADRGVYATTETTLVVDRLAGRSSAERRRLHEITIVLLDAEGRRAGEAAWSVRLDVVGDR